jgi:hypothetical protein
MKQNTYSTQTIPFIFYADSSSSSNTTSSIHPSPLSGQNSCEGIMPNLSCKQALRRWINMSPTCVSSGILTISGMVWCSDCTKNKMWFPRLYTLNSPYILVFSPWYNGSIGGLGFPPDITPNQGERLARQCLTLFGNDLPSVPTERNRANSLSAIGLTVHTD